MRCALKRDKERQFVLALFRSLQFRMSCHSPIFIENKTNKKYKIVEFYVKVEERGEIKVKEMRRTRVGEM